MKTKMKRQGTTELPRFIVGALATAGASGANGATVQISFANNMVSSATGTANFVADLTGGLQVPLGVVARLSLGVAVYGPGGGLAGEAENSGTLNNFIQVGSITIGEGRDTPLFLHGLVQIAFSDLRINDGVSSSGWLDMTAYAFESLYTVQIHRLIFDDESTAAPINVAFSDGDYPAWQVSAVPEPGSNLALLALGAGGLTLRRRLKRAA